MLASISSKYVMLRKVGSPELRCRESLEYVEELREVLGFQGSRTAEALQSSQSCESKSASFTFSPLRNMLECYDCCKKKVSLDHP